MPGTLGTVGANVNWSQVNGSVFNFGNGSKAKKTSWRKFIDGYYSQFQRSDKNKPNVATLIYCRDLAISYLSNQKFSEFKQLCIHLATRWGVDLVEGMEYVRQNPEWKSQLTSDENLESGNLGEALQNVFERLVVAPVAGILSTVGSGLTSVVLQFLKRLLPLLGVVVVCWVLFQNRNKLISKK